MRVRLLTLKQHQSPLLGRTLEALPVAPHDTRMGNPIPVITATGHTRRVDFRADIELDTPTRK